MDNLTDSPSPSPAPASVPIFPALPTTTAKNITRAILTASAILVGIGGWYAKEVEVDPEMANVISERINIPGLVTAGTGILGIMLGLFQQMQHTDQARVAVAAAAAAPPCDSNGECSVRHTLTTSLTQASQVKDFATAGKILDLLKSLEEQTGLGRSV